MKRHKRKILMALTAIILLVFLYTQNNWIKVTSYDVESAEIMNDIRIVHITDLHGKVFGRNNKRLIELIKNKKPDIIVFTGDLIDRSGRHFKESIDTLKELQGFRPVYYVPGNHEYWSGKSDEVFKALREANVNVLRCENKNIEINNNKISILGMDETGVDRSIFTESLNEFEKSGGYKVLLSHYPENINEYKACSVNLVLSGHTHGGQFRIPFLGGLYAPGQGFFPEYDWGRYNINGKDFIISSGLGNSSIPIRLFNRPEIVVINLKPAK